MRTISTSTDSDGASDGRFARIFRHGVIDMVFCIGAMILLLALPSTESSPPGEDVDPSVRFRPLHAPSPKTEKMLEAMKTFKEQWEADQVKGISRTTKEMLKKLSPAGDTFFMRYPSQLGDFPAEHPEILRMFQYARISNNYETRKKLLLEIAEDRELPEMIRYRAYVGVSRSAFREGSRAVEDQGRYAREALDLFPSDERAMPWLSDAYYLLALDADAMGRRRHAIGNLLKSLELDDSCLEAHWRLVRLLAGEFVEYSRIPPARLMNMTTWMLKSLQSITELTKNKKDFHQLADNLRPRSHSPFIAFAVGYCYLQAGDLNGAGRFLSDVAGLRSGNAALREIILKSRELMKSNALKAPTD